MIRRSQFILNLTVQELKTLSSAKKWSGKMWDKPPNEILPIKAKISNQLRANQTRCAYCGLELGGTSRGEVEHIAPKAKYRYPQFTFSLWNLVMACEYCNGFSKKGTTPTVSRVHDKYKKCDFYLVHPYFDDPDQHYDWVDEIVIIVRNNSLKAQFTIKLFELASPKMTQFRAKQRITELIANQYPLSAADDALMQQIRNYV